MIKEILRNVKGFIQSETKQISSSGNSSRTGIQDVMQKKNHNKRERGELEASGIFID